jgi:FkbM family methyltransferase
LSIFSGVKKRMNATLNPFLDPVFADVFESSPLAIYDVGAAGGVYCPLESPPCERVQVYGFEPVKRSYDSLTRVYGDNPFVEIRNVALAGHDGTIILNEVGDGNETISSLLPLDGLGVKTTAVKVECCRLDNVPRRFEFPSADFIKLDTEGSEDQILDSGTEQLSHNILGVTCEISFWRRATGGAVFSDIDKLLTNAGFVLFDLQINRSHISSIGGKKDKVRSGDALYLRDFGHLNQQMPDTSIAEKRVKLLKLLCLCVAWRYLNYAIELIAFGRQENLITADEFDRLSRMFCATTDIAELVPDFPGRSTLATLFDVLSSALHKQAKKGVPPVFNEIGNSWVMRRRGVQPDQVRIYYPIISDGPPQHIKPIHMKKRP